MANTLMQELQKVFEVKPMSLLQLIDILNECPNLDGNTGQHIQVVKENKPYCFLHFKMQEMSQGCALPNVNIKLKDLKVKINNMLVTHYGKLPLMSFQDCYNDLYGPLAVDPQGVPLEHLLTSLRDVQIIRSFGHKYLIWKPREVIGSDENERFQLNEEQTALSDFTKKLLELLKSTCNGLILVSHLSHEYKRRYGKFLNIRDYCVGSLETLLDSLPHIIEVIDTTQGKAISLSHKIQTKRFTYDVLKILRKIPNKYIPFDSFPDYYYKSLDHVWNPGKYGACDLEDLFENIPLETLKIIEDENGNRVICVPRKEQSLEEKKRTRLFCKEVREMIGNKHNCSMNFQNFIPSYHHYFGRQCRVSKFGFEKLIELFESIPDVVSIENYPGGFKLLRLTLNERLKVLGEKILSLIRNSRNNAIRLNELPELYKYEYNHTLLPSNFDEVDFERLLRRLSQYFTIKQKDNDFIICGDIDLVLITLKIRRCLMDKKPMSDVELSLTYFEIFQEPCRSVGELLTIIPEVVTRAYSVRDDRKIQLTKLQVIANDLYKIVAFENNCVHIDDIQKLYRIQCDKLFTPKEYGCINSASLFNRLSETFIVNPNNYVHLNPLILEAGYIIPDCKVPKYALWNAENNIPNGKNLIEIITEQSNGMMIENNKSVMRVTAPSNNTGLIR